MSNSGENIHPIFDVLLKREDKENLLEQKAALLWFTGLSGSGKSTIAQGVERMLHDKGILCKVLDGDNVRSGLNNNLGFSSEDRTENIRRIAEVAKLFLENGTVVLASFVSPLKSIRDQAREIVGTDDFLEVFVNTPLEECERRDVKGLYKKARAGEIPNFTGIDAPFEAPESPFLELDTTSMTPEQSVSQVLKALLPHIQIKQ